MIRAAVRAFLLRGLILSTGIAFLTLVPGAAINVTGGTLAFRALQMAMIGLILGFASASTVAVEAFFAKRPPAFLSLGLEALASGLLAETALALGLTNVIYFMGFLSNRAGLPGGVDYVRHFVTTSPLAPWLWAVHLVAPFAVAPALRRWSAKLWLEAVATVPIAALWTFATEDRAAGGFVFPAWCAAFALLVVLASAVTRAKSAEKV